MDTLLQISFKDETQSSWYLLRDSTQYILYLLYMVYIIIIPLVFLVSAEVDCEFDRDVAAVEGGVVVVVGAAVQGKSAKVVGSGER